MPSIWDQIHYTSSSIALLGIMLTWHLWILNLNIKEIIPSLMWGGNIRNANIMWSCSQGICSLGRKLKIRHKMNYERLGDTKLCINNVYLYYITFQYWDWLWHLRSGWVLSLVSVWKKMIVYCHFTWILNLGGISYHKIASLAGACPIHRSPSLGSP